MAGGKREGAGRPKGSLNKATAEIKALAQEHAPKAMKELARLATSAESEQARVSAIKELFDRGFGKATQHVEADVVARFSEIRRTLVDPRRSDS